MKEYDVDNDDQITHAEFLDGLRKWCKDLNLHRQPSIGHSVAEVTCLTNFQIPSLIYMTWQMLGVDLSYQSYFQIFKLYEVLLNQKQESASRDEF